MSEAPERKKPKKKHKGAPEWMITYGDMVTLLLTFFILMFTTAEIDGQELRLILSAFQSALGMSTGGNTLSKGKLVEMGMSIESLPAKEKGKELAKAKKDAVALFQPEIKSRKVRIQEDERGVVISLTSDNFFRRGSVQLESKAARRMIGKVAKLLTGLVNNVRIEGHTDNTPIDPTSPLARRYPTNWELSAARATFLLRDLIELGVAPRRLSAAGYAEYRSIEDSATPEGRAYNRRVDIIILREEFK